MKAELREKLEEILAALDKASLEHMPMGLLSGKLGLALFYLEYSRYCGSDKYQVKGVALIELIFAETAFEIDHYNFSMGMSGLGWLLEYCNGKCYLEVNTAEVFGEKDELLYKRMVSELSRGNYDYLLGGLGIFLYFLSKPAGEKVDGWLSHGLELLEGLSVKEGELISWPDYDLVDDHPLPGRRNLGMAHGVPGILVVLCKAYEQGIAQQRCMELIRGTTDYLLSLFDEFSGSNSIYPNFDVPEELPDKHSRLAWCYGDLSVCLGLHAAAGILKDKLLDEVIIKLLVRCAGRRDVVINRVEGDGLCHGYAGLGYLFNKFDQRYSDLWLAEASEHWYRLSLESTCERLDLLEGLPGVGLSYMGYLQQRPTGWEEVLLIS